MRKITTGETLGLAAAITFATATGACGTSEGTVNAAASPSASSEAATDITPSMRPAMRVIGATVINGRDSAGRKVGVRTYAGPENPRAIGSYPEGEHIGVLCVAAGRTVTDKDVPAGQGPVVSDKWYLLNSSREDWMGNGYAHIDNGAKVSACPVDMLPTGPVTVTPTPTRTN